MHKQNKKRRGTKTERWLVFRAAVAGVAGIAAWAPEHSPRADRQPRCAGNVNTHQISRIKKKKNISKILLTLVACSIL